jgi:transcriptional regulator with XRE-family HTH domain
VNVDRKTLNILLAALDIEQRELAERMGYDKGYVVNIFNGFTAPSDGFKRTFGEVVADLVLGSSRTDVSRLPAQPLIEYLRRRAQEAECRSQFYEDLGLTPQGWHRRKYVSESLLDRICCQLGIHPSEIYGDDYEVA